MAYLNSEPVEGCIFCVKPRENRDQENGILFRSRSCFVILNAYPYNPGHLMVVPYSHVSSMTKLDDDELTDVMTTTRMAIEIIDGAMAPDGFNIGINQGRPAGAGIADHVHQHVVPRWSGDTNFMTTVSSTKVLPELVDQTFEKLRPRFDEFASSKG
jgi:ATP adenylyltransferase